MKIQIDGKNYTELRDLSFAPETDLTGNSIPINEFTADIRTDDDIAIWQYAFLYDDREILWAKYWITKAEKEKGIVHVTAQSLIAVLDRQTMDLDRFENEDFSTQIARVFAYAPQASYTIDLSLADRKLTGFVPVQTARERLLWLCFAAGAYVRTFFSETVDILPVSSAAVLIPLNKTYWRPEISYDDIVTRISVKGYSWVEGTPEATDEWISDGSGHTYYIQTDTLYSLNNNYAPQGAPKNEVVIEDITLITPDNASEILSRLAGFYFNRASVDMSVINNAEYIPGQKIYGYIGEEDMIQGYIERADFSFGNQAKAELHVIGVGAGEGMLMETGRLIVRGVFGNYTVYKKTYTFPTGYSYEFDNVYVDTHLNGKRYILRPLTSKTSGTMGNVETIVEVEHSAALVLDNHVLYVISVDEASGSEVVAIG